MAAEPQDIESPGLEIAVDRAAEVPIGTQLAWALRARIRDGTFKPEQRLPGLRELAQEAGVNVNTVRAAYQRLEHEGLIEGQQGAGTFVSPVAHRPSAVGTIAANAVREAEATGVDPRDVAAALYVSRASIGSPASEGVGRRRRLREQIATLERTLAELEANYPGLVPPSTTKRRGGPALLGAAELEDVRTLLVRRLASVQEAIDELQNEETVSEKTQAAPAPTRKSRARARPRVRPATAGA